MLHNPYIMLWVVGHQIGLPISPFLSMLASRSAPFYRNFQVDTSVANQGLWTDQANIVHEWSHGGYLDLYFSLACNFSQCPWSPPQLSQQHARYHQLEQLLDFNSSLRAGNVPTIMEGRWEFEFMVWYKSIWQYVVWYNIHSIWATIVGNKKTHNQQCEFLTSMKEDCNWYIWS